MLLAAVSGGASLAATSRTTRQAEAAGRRRQAPLLVVGVRRHSLRPSFHIPLALSPAQDNATPLHLAAAAGSVECVSLLLGAGSSFKLCDAVRGPPLLPEAKSAAVEKRRTLPSFFSSCREDRSIPASSSCYSRCFLPCALLLLQEGRTPLIRAVEGGSVPCATELLLWQAARDPARGAKPRAAPPVMAPLVRPSALSALVVFFHNNLLHLSLSFSCNDECCNTFLEDSDPPTYLLRV